MRYLQIKHHDKKSTKEKSPDIIDTKRRVTKLVAPVMLVVVWSLGDRVKDRHYRPGRVTLRVARKGSFELPRQPTGPALFYGSNVGAPGDPKTPSFDGSKATPALK